MLTFLFDAVGKVLVWLTKQLARLIALLVVQAVRHPRSSAAAGACTAEVVMVGWQLSLVIVGGALVALSTWKAAHPASFGATVATWTRTWWRRWWIYRRQWEQVLTKCELTVQAGPAVGMPKLKGVKTTPWWDFITVEMPIGQSSKRYRQEETADALRLAFGGERLVVKTLQPRRIELAIRRRDPLMVALPATAIPASVEAIDWRRVPVGVDEFGRPYCVSLLGGHTVVAGSTGGGKGSLGWNVLRAVAPAIAAGLVRPVLIDPKLMELSPARNIAAADDYIGEGTPDEDLPEATLAFLLRLVAEMGEAKQAAAAAGERDFTAPRTDRQLVLILIDELAPLLKLWPRRVRDKIEDALGLLLTQGRAAGYIVLGAIQEPTKDVFGLRDLFTRRLALRLPTESHTDAALIEKAVEYGALCHEIPETLPGVFYSLQDGSRSTLRARFGHVTDVDIDELVAYLAPSADVVDLADAAERKTIAA